MSLPQAAAPLVSFCLAFVLWIPQRSSAAPPSEQPLPVSGTFEPSYQPFDDLLREFIAQHQVPGAALAVARNGKIVLARGYGYADLDAKTPVQPDSLFRIASLSKPITAVAIMQLVERGQLRLEDRIFDLLALEKPSPPPAANEPSSPPSTLDPRWREITILHLLQHRGGFDRDRSFDPMFRAREFAAELHIDPPALPRDIIRAMLSRPLDFAPGERVAYSNFGYCLLGRAIERASGKPYERAVRDSVLLPLEIRSPRLARSLLADRAPGEVRYYPLQEKLPSVFARDSTPKTFSQYGGWCLEAMDAHGGWLASAPDLANFALALEDPVRSSLLKPDSIRALFAPPPTPPPPRTPPTSSSPSAPPPAPPAPPSPPVPKERQPQPAIGDAYAACGWMVRPGPEGRRTYWHFGQLNPGTSTLLVHRQDGFVWAVLFNADSGKGGRPLNVLLDPLLHTAADRCLRP